MVKFARVGSIVFAACIIAGLGGWTAMRSAEAGPLVFDEEIGHYKDLSYDALSDEELSWEERASLFGGETTHYAKLTGDQRKAKQKELKALLATIKMKETNNWADPNLERQLGAREAAAAAGGAAAARPRRGVPAGAQGCRRGLPARGQPGRGVPRRGVGPKEL